jgi:hypothetical protein
VEPSAPVGAASTLLLDEHVVAGDERFLDEIAYVPMVQPEKAARLRSALDALG